MSDLSQSVCSACSVDTGECPNCGTFWWRSGGGKRQGCRPATEHDAVVIRRLQARGGTTGYEIVFAHELPNRIGVDRR